MKIQISMQTSAPSRYHSSPVVRAILALATLQGLCAVASSQQTYHSVANREFWPALGGGLDAKLDRLEDYDGDGIGEILVGDWFFGYLDMHFPPGKISVLSGATGEEIYGYLGDPRGPDGPEENLGFDIAALGDVDGDGAGDFCGGCLLGPARVWSGKDGSEIFRSLDNVENVVALGDVNGDGLADFGLRRSTSPWGSIAVHVGGTFEVLYTVRPPFLVWLFGFEILSLGDVNDDGSPDFAASAPDLPYRFPFENCHVGHVFVYSGKDGLLLYEIPGVEECDFFGYALAAPGDLNGDRVGDLAVSVPELSAQGVPFGDGRVSFHDGKTGALLGEARVPRQLNFFAKALEAVGDVNGNGYGDVLAYGGVTDYQNPLRSYGTAWLVDGGTKKPLYVVLNQQPPAPEFQPSSFATVLSGLEDRHGDDFPDFLVGSTGTSRHIGRLDWFDGAPIGVRAFGQPCSKIPGVTPRIGASGVPRMGSDYELHLSRVDPGQQGLLVVGLSSTTWNGRGLPLDLGYLGLSGCDLLVSPDAVYMAVAREAGGTDAAATVRLSFETHIALLNRPLYAQWVLFGRRGAAVTRALELTLQMPESSEAPEPR